MLYRCWCCGSPRVGFVLTATAANLSHALQWKTLTGMQSTNTTLCHPIRVWHLVHSGPTMFGALDIDSPLVEAGALECLSVDVICQWPFDDVPVCASGRCASSSASSWTSIARLENKSLLINGTRAIFANALDQYRRAHALPHRSTQFPFCGPGTRVRRRPICP